MADENPVQVLSPPVEVSAQEPPVSSMPEVKDTHPPPATASFSVTEKETPHAVTENETPPEKPEQPEFIPEAPVEPLRTPKLPETMVSFKEESNIVKDLSHSEKKALDELTQLVGDAIEKGEFAFRQLPAATADVAEPSSGTEETHAAESQVVKEIKPAAVEIGSSEEEISIWGIPLLKDERSDVILLKFLRARDFKVKEAFAMLKNTLRWRKEFSVDSLVDENLGDDLEKVVFMHGFDKEGHPVCYNVYGEFQNKKLYQKTFSDEEKRFKFLRWRIQFLERSIRKLDFRPGGISTVFYVADFKNSPGLGKKELRIATRQALHMLQDNYPEFVAKQVFVNVPWWYLAFYTMMSPFMTQRTKSKFVFASPARTPEILFKYISPEQVPVQYGGLSVDYCDCNPEFTISDPAAEITVKPATKQMVEIIANEKCTFTWELRVVGWDVSYSAEYVPNDDRGYTVIIQKARKMIPTDEPVVSNSFNITELGKIILTVDNSTSKKKKLLYRFKVNPLS